MVLCQSEVMVTVLCNRKDQSDVHCRQGSYPRECRRQPAKLLTPQRRWTQSHFILAMVERHLAIFVVIYPPSTFLSGGRATSRFASLPTFLICLNCQVPSNTLDRAYRLISNFSFWLQSHCDYHLLVTHSLLYGTQWDIPFWFYLNKVSWDPPWITKKCMGRKIGTFSSCVKMVSWETPVNHEKVHGTKNEDFLQPCQEGQLGPPAIELSAAGAKLDFENNLKLYSGLTIQSRPALA